MNTFSVNVISEISALHSLPVNSEMAFANAASMSDAVIDLMEDDMAVPVEKIKQIIGRFAVIFTPPNSDINDVADIWHNALQDYTEEQVIKASSHLVKTIKHFPFPADVIQTINREGF